MKRQKIRHVVHDDVATISIWRAFLKYGARREGSEMSVSTSGIGRAFLKYGAQREGSEMSVSLLDTVHAHHARLWTARIG